MQFKNIVMFNEPCRERTYILHTYIHTYIHTTWKLEVRSKKLEVRSKKLEVRSKKLEVRNKKRPYPHTHISKDVAI